MQEELALEQRANPDKSLMTSDDRSKKTAIRLALAKLAIRRQANPGKETMDMFAADLVPMEETDVFSALESLSCRRRAEGETAFPDWPTILEEIESVRAHRRAEKRRAEREAERAEWERHRKEHPEEYVSVKSVWDEVKERMANKENVA